MTKMYAITASGNPARGCIVGRPQPADGVGSALRSAFSGGEPAVPPDMCRLLAAIDRRDSRRV
jgi:hypothetical protein